MSPRRAREEEKNARDQGSPLVVSQGTSSASKKPKVINVNLATSQEIMTIEIPEANFSTPMRAFVQNTPAIAQHGERLGFKAQSLSMDAITFFPPPKRFDEPAGSLLRQAKDTPMILITPDNTAAAIQNLTIEQIQAFVEGPFPPLPPPSSSTWMPALSQPSPIATKSDASGLSDLQALVKRVDGLQAKAEQSETKIVHLEAEIRGLKEENRDLKEENRDLKEENLDLKEEIRYLKEEIHDLKEENEKHVLKANEHERRLNGMQEMHAFVRGVVSIGFAGTNRSEIEEQEEALLKKGEHLEDVPPDMTRMERLHHYAELNLYTECEMLVFRKHSQRYVHFAKDSA